MDIRCIIIPLSVVLILSKTAEALNCYQCDSTQGNSTKTCQEMFRHDIDTTLRATECKMFDAKFCIKVTGIWKGIVGTHRFCSSRDLGDQCQEMYFPDHSRKYRGCIFTCTADECNAAHGIISSYSTLFVGVLSAVVAMVTRR